MQNILIIEDDEKLAALTAEYLESQGFRVDWVGEGTDAVDRIVQSQPDLVLLDLMLPGKDGVTICREARFEYSGPVIMLTASGDDVDQILGLEIGADDFITKPVEPRILLARIRALLRRTSTETKRNSTSPRILTIGNLVINASARAVEIDGNPLDLSSTEYEVILYLAEHAGQIVSREALFQSLRNLDYDGQSRFIDITISQIRKKLGDTTGQYLKTVRGKGYLLAVTIE